HSRHPVVVERKFCLLCRRQLPARGVIGAGGQPHQRDEQHGSPRSQRSVRSHTLLMCQLPRRAYGAWRTSSGVSHPEPRGGRHGASPSPEGGGFPPLPCATASTVQIPCHLRPPLASLAAVTMGCPMAARVMPFQGAGGEPDEPADPWMLSWG